ncbi:glycoside hydrolase family 108 protein [Hymenobacter ruricola]|uniref:Peptidoglycan-binding protein n=1 Tax=Hymenobacter ruricola TaxID=2791023 RepID=A0ABS0I6T5_9BACT|nr:glycosyl hydrolase 108 family protein [Hymenobacter ruricola]MBF9222685.1 hypothetical protein [Hymenobacter ruricola]
MADFSGYFPKLLRNEGNYCHHPTDPGGETYRGIARVYNRNWAGWPIVDAVKKQLGLTSPVPKASWGTINKALGSNAGLGENIKQFYQALYWNPLRLNEVESQSVAEQLADHGVNAGISRPAKMLQFLLSTEYGAAIQVDGKIGPLTIEALNSTLPPLFYLSLVEMRRAFYYYRAGCPLTSTPNMAAWRDFLHNKLNVRPDGRMKQYLASWLSRTQVPFVS